MRIGQHICIIAYTSCTMHTFIFSHRTIRLEKNNSIKKSHLSLNRRFLASTNHVAQYGNSLSEFMIEELQFSTPHHQSKGAIFPFSVYLLMSKSISYAFRNNIQSRKSHLKQSKHKNFIPFIKAIKNSIYILC